MKNLLLPLLLIISVAGTLSAQNTRKANPPEGPAPNPDLLQVSWPGKASVPPVANPFGLPTGNKIQTLPALVPVAPNAASVHVETDPSTGIPIVFKGRTAASTNTADGQSPESHALEYLASLQPQGINNPEIEFNALETHTDEQGNLHVRFQQVCQGLPVYGAEVIAHTHNGMFDMLNGRYQPSPKLQNTQANINADQALEMVKANIGLDKVKTNWTDQEKTWVGGNPARNELIVWIDAEQNPHLAWHYTYYPNLLRRHEYFLDAHDGSILNHFDNTCNFAGELPPPDGAVTASGLDLLNVNRSFGAWQNGSTIYMEDASKSMFNSSQSNMPTDPVGAIVTLDALNTSPESQNSFNYDFVKSTTTTFNNKKAVSAEYNASKSFDYYKSSFNRNSIDGGGGNILCFVNVADGDGSSMENAFWNGAAMWYGNGGSTFKELARGLDVGGHEMTHGVIEKTANLEYQGESGAINESFADVFGAMIDRDDWKIGEDVMQAGVSPNGCLRDMQNPHNGASNSNSPWWQPQHVNEKYNGTQDNGGVHINSGIPNHAFYLFASNAAVGKDKAEQVFYKALRDYLVKSSKFVDLRIAVLQASNDLYGASVANAAASAFDQVGITGSAPSGNYLGQLAANPGTDYMLCTTTDLNNLQIVTGSGSVLGSIYTNGIKSRPSITDNGSQVVFVNTAGHIIGIDMTYGTQINFQASQLSSNPEWRSAAISKDGRFIAALADVKENKIYIFDLLSPGGNSQTFTLYNPTYSQGQVTGDVSYADIMEFDYSGESLMYDSYNELSNSQGQDLSYWDIGFLNFWNNGNFTSATNAPISKLFSGLPPNTSIGNPTFAKNSPYIIAFDFIDYDANQNDVYGANVETGDYNAIYTDNGDLGWPSYNRLDNAVLMEGPTFFSTNIYKQPISANKIQGQGNATTFVSDRYWPVWFATGNRSLTVGNSAVELGKMQMSAAPNPTAGNMQLSIEAVENAPARVSVVSTIGQTLISREVELQTGKNYLDINLDTLPAGQYFVRLESNHMLGTLMVVKL